MTSRRGGTGGGANGVAASSSSSTSVEPVHSAADNDDYEREPLASSAAGGGFGPDDNNNILQGSGSSSDNASVIPGRWKHGLCNLSQYGLCHPSCCQACCCVPLASAQVLNRLGVSWRHRKGPQLFQFLLVVCAAFWITRVILFLLIALLDPNVGSTEWIEPGWGYYTVIVLDDSLALIYFVVSVYLLRYARQRVRHRHSIPEGDACPNGCEDMCCSLFCSCCVASQLLRQTTEYGVTPARCCTEHGLLVPPSTTTTNLEAATTIRGSNAGSAVELV